MGQIVKIQPLYFYVFLIPGDIYRGIYLVKRLGSNPGPKGSKRAPGGTPLFYFNGFYYCSLKMS